MDKNNWEIEKSKGGNRVPGKDPILIDSVWILYFFLFEAHLWLEKRVAEGADSSDEALMDHLRDLQREKEALANQPGAKKRWVDPTGRRWNYTIRAVNELDEANFDLKLHGEFDPGSIHKKDRAEYNRDAMDFLTEQRRVRAAFRTGGGGATKPAGNKNGE